MRKIESMSLFLYNSMFFESCLRAPGGLLTWLSTFLTQFFYYPWAGALIIAAMSVGIQLLTSAAFRVPKEYFPITIIPAALVLISFLRLGYLVFTLKPLGATLLLPLGVIACLSLLCLMNHLRQTWARALFVFCVVAIGYPLLGFYALLAAFACAVTCVLDRDGTSIWVKTALVAEAVILSLAIPRIWFFAVNPELMLSQIYYAGLPRFFSNETSHKAFYYAVFAIIVILSALSPIISKAQSSGKKATCVALGVWCASIAAVFCFRYNDANFKLALDMDRAIWDQQWSEATQLSDNQQDSPTRLVTVLTYISLMRQGECSDKMFLHKYGWEPYHTTRDARPLTDAAGALVSYHLGLINYAYRWGTEYSIEHCHSVERMKMLAKCALLNYEFKLARTYLDVIYNMPMHRAWAQKYIRYCNNPVEMNGDPELASIKQLMCHQNEFINDGGAFEGYVWPTLATAPVGTAAFNELSLQAALINRDLDSFMAKLPVWAEGQRHMPRYFQEAALLWSLMQKQECPIVIDSSVKDRHDQFFNAFRSSSDMEAEHQRDFLKPMFADTYWYYFIFTEDQILN